MSEPSGTDSGGTYWKSFLRRHWSVVAILAVGGALAVAGAVYVFLWFVKSAQSSGVVPAVLGSWTMANVVSFILYSILWEILFVGIPVAVTVIVAWLWWRKLPADERAGYRRGRRSRSARNSGGVSLFFFIAFCIKVFLDGKWNVPVSTFTLDYVVGSMVMILIWCLVILGIPAAIAVAWWLSREMKTP